MKNQKGITLVALVITIIVLLILAGVSISLVLGNNGILTKASDAVVKNEAAVAAQEVQTASADANMTYYAAWTEDGTVKKSSYYTTNVFKNNCASASQVAITPVADDNTEIYVKYSTSTGANYYFKITVADGDSEAIAESAYTTAMSGVTPVNCK